jgi:hypothetical protein
LEDGCGRGEKGEGGCVLEKSGLEDRMGILEFVEGILETVYVWGF